MIEVTNEILVERVSESVTMLSIGVLILCSFSICVVIVSLDTIDSVNITPTWALIQWPIWTSAVWSFTALLLPRRTEEEK